MIPLSKTKAKYIKSLQLKKNRDKENMFLVEGKKSVLEFINSEFKIASIISTQEFYEENESQLHDYEVIIAKVAELSALGTLKTNNAAIAIVVKSDDNKLLNNYDGVILALDGINDPGNLGTIIRTADWFGIEQILLNDQSVDAFNPKVISASKGSISRVKVYNQPLIEFLENYQGEIIIADMYGTSIDQIKPITSGVIIMGNESHGVSREVQEFATQTVTIPSSGRAESLNVGVATGIICNRLIGKA